MPTICADVLTERLERLTVRRDHKRRLGRSPDDLLALFRLLWARPLDAEGRTAAQVAHFLGFENADQCARRLGYKFGLKKSDIYLLRYEVVVAWVAECCTTQRRTTLRVMGQRLIKDAMQQTGR